VAFSVILYELLERIIGYAQD